MSFDAADLEPLDRSVALTADADALLGQHVHKPGRQEDLTFAFWRPSRGATRLTAVIHEVLWPDETERVLQGNVAFTEAYLQRALLMVPVGSGIALMHGHLGPGWQDLSRDDGPVLPQNRALQEPSVPRVIPTSGRPVLPATCPASRSCSAVPGLRRVAVVRRPAAASACS
jgi:hypothetical protein